MTKIYSNFMIYYNNLSVYYIFCVFISIIAILLTWLFHFKNSKHEQSKLSSKQNSENDKNEFDLILTSFKEQKKQTMQQIAATLTEDQLKQEKEMEREQLRVILELLTKQEDKFQVASMEELENQLKLYR